MGCEFSGIGNIFLFFATLLIESAGHLPQRTRRITEKSGWNI